MKGERKKTIHETPNAFASEFFDWRCHASRCRSACAGRFVKKCKEVALAHHTEVIASCSERHPLLLALLPACAGSQVIMRQDCSAYAEEPLRTVGLLEAAHQYNQDCNKRRAKICGGGKSFTQYENESHISSHLRAVRADACEFMRVGRAPPFGVMVRRIALDSSPASSGQKHIKPSRLGAPSKKQPFLAHVRTQIFDMF